MGRVRLLLSVGLRWRVGCSVFLKSCWLRNWCSFVPWICGFRLVTCGVPWFFILNVSFRFIWVG